MQKKTKQKKANENHAKEDSDHKHGAEEKGCETVEEGNWSEDQQQKSYYYDDAYGYEIYNPDDEETESST